MSDTVPRFSGQAVGAAGRAAAAAGPAAAVLAAVAVTALLGLAPALWAGGAEAAGPARLPDRWIVRRGPAFNVLGETGRPGADPVEAAAVLEETAARVAAALGQPWPPPAGEDSATPDLPPVRLVVLLGRGAAAPPFLRGLTYRAIDAASPDGWRLAAAKAVLAQVARENRVSDPLAAGLSFYLTTDREQVRARALALAERGRLASVPQLLSWWPALPGGRDQIASFAGFVDTRWGAGKFTILARSQPEYFQNDAAELDRKFSAALGVTAAEVDAEWTAAVKAGASGLDPSVLADARTAVDRELGQARARTVGPALAVLGAAGFCALALGPRGRARKGAALALLAFAVAAALELGLFTSGATLPVKFGVAVTEPAVFALVLVAWRARSRPGAGPAEGAHVAGGAKGDAMESPAAATGAERDAARPGLELLAAAALFVAIMAPRVGIYYYSREIWAKAPMIVLALGLAFWTEGGGLGSLGLGKARIGRLVSACLLGVLAFRLTTGLTQVAFYGVFARITGPSFAWSAYEPWWRAVGFNHFPLSAWPSWFPLLDVGDFFFGNFAEELFFRGYLLSRLQKAMGWGKALLAQAVLFGLFHVNYDLFPLDPWGMFFYVLMAMAFGVLMALLLRHGGTLLVPALVHPLSNLGVLWVGVTYTGYWGGWPTWVLYYVIQAGLGFLVIPAVFRLARGDVRRGPRLPSLRRRQRGPYVEARYA